MIACIARIHIVEGKEAEFEAGMLELIPKVRENEPGTRLYTLCKDASGRYLMLELFDDQAAWDAHRHADYIEAAPDAQFKGMLAATEFVRSSPRHPPLGRAASWLTAAFWSSTAAVGPNRSTTWRAVIR